MEFQQVTCPTCFESFPVMIDSSGSDDFEMDYDCEVCCRPLVIHVTGGQVQSLSLDDLG